MQRSKIVIQKRYIRRADGSLWRYKMINKGELWQGDINGVIVKITDRKIESGKVYVKYKQLDKYGSPVLPEREVTEQAFSHCGMRRIK
nr:MAG TPA: hypothetical protein [Caudoviricetes sp.]